MNRLPLIIIDEIMLPGTTTEVGLDDGEARALMARGADEMGTTVAVACRVPGAPVPTRMEQRSSGSPGPLMEAVLIGVGLVVPADELEPTPRLLLERVSRARLGEVVAKGDGFEAMVTPWPVTRGGSDEALAKTLGARFFRALLAARAEGEPGGREQVEKPVLEVSRTSDPVEALFLMADYLFNEPEARKSVLLAEESHAVAGWVGSMLDAIESGLPAGPGTVRRGMEGWLGDASREGLGSLADTAAVLLALAPLCEPSDELLAETAAVVEASKALQARFDRLAERLLKPPKRKPRAAD
ncbi:MAG: hypothetical protein R3F39_17495 [Myxococcota bacterium]